MKKIAIIVMVCLSLALSAAFTGPVAAESEFDGQVVKMEGLSTLYYVIDGKRYVFPNGKIYNSWFTDFADVLTISEEDLYGLSLAGNVRYRPGVLMIKIQTDPKVYAVANNGRLRWVKTEAIAKKHYGDSWNQLIDDVPDSFFTDYEIDEPIEDDADFNADDEASENDTIEKNRGLKLGHAKQKKATTAKCRAIPATPATPNKKGQPATPATPATPARECKVIAGDDGDDDGDDTTADETAPIIGTTTVAVASTSATVSWNTDEAATGKVMYSMESPVIASTSETVLSDALETEHSFELSGLKASTTYYFIVESADETGNNAVRDEDSFETLAE